MSRRRHPADDPERRKWQDPYVILSSIGVREGDVFVDVGCGEGYFALPAARRIGKKGQVYAIDINEEAVAQLRRQADDEGLSQLQAFTARAEEAVLCDGCADIVFFGNDLHDFSDPGQVIMNARTMLKTSGRVVDLDWKAEPMDIGPPVERRFSVERVKHMIQSARLQILSVQEAGPYHYMIIAAR
ncbi:MAG: methyltransferase domain-containing protein [Methanomicrobiales archaeon]|nr:methyltransferase domain-containing protein [Methanomicrobiales archaeon]